jgi:hypothetical protein
VVTGPQLTTRIILLLLKPLERILAVRRHGLESLRALITLLFLLNLLVLLT